MVHVYAVDITDLPDPLEYPKLMEELSENRKQKIIECRQQESRKQSLGAGLLLRHVLKSHGILEQAIWTGKYGKPETEGIYFNLSHSKNMVVCAVSEGIVGCDIEKISKLPEKVADRFFCEDEIKYLNQVSAEKRSEEFFRLWTMKESYIKMTGEGLHLPLNRFEMCFSEEGIKVRRDGEIQNCFFKEYDMPGYKLTVCAKEKEFAEQILLRFHIDEICQHEYITNI